MAAPGGSISQQEHLSDAYRYSLYSTMTDVALSTMQAYLSVKRYQALSVAARDNIASLERVRDTARLRADAGLSSQSDVLQAETRIAACGPPSNNTAPSNVPRRHS